MVSLDTDVLMHRLPLKPDCKHVKQQLRRMNPEWNVKIMEEVMKQYEAAFLDYLE